MKNIDNYIKNQIGKENPDRLALLVLFLVTFLQLIRHKEVSMSQKEENKKTEPSKDEKIEKTEERSENKFYAAISGQNAGYVYSTVGAIATVASIYFLVTAFSWLLVLALVASIALLIVGVRCAGFKMPKLAKDPEVTVNSSEATA